ncbi:MAG TPA: sigma-70 family RNA polymerase sigma factor [bacterium]|nr:sigma-70 family RNA polymerase sigma factor [bacterium]
MDDPRLIERLRAGDDAAFADLVQETRPRLYATACHFLGYQDPDAWDVVQDTYTAALKSLAGFEGRSSLYTWLNHICVNLCFSRLRVRKRQVAEESESLELRLAPLALERGRVAAEAEEKDQRLALLTGLMADMGEPCAELLRWRFVDGLGLQEIRERLKTPLGTVASRIHRCLKRLKERAGA